jgi:hypothetical protein
MPWLVSTILVGCAASSAGTADRIVQEGFDIRLVNHASSYGNGVYFAGWY